jgi:hypothetical protein
LVPFRRATAAIAEPSSWIEIPDDSWKLANESSSGEVRTPPKSLHAEQVNPRSVSITEMPAKQRRVQRQTVEDPVDAGADRLARQAARVVVLHLLLGVIVRVLGKPQLESRAGGSAILAVRGRQARVGDRSSRARLEQGRADHVGVLTRRRFGAKREQRHALIGLEPRAHLTERREPVVIDCERALGSPAEALDGLLLTLDRDPSADPAQLVRAVPRIGRAGRSKPGDR